MTNKGYLYSMRGSVYSKEIKKQALDLRREGKSYEEILSIYPIPKSTLATWCITEKIPSPFTHEKQRAHLERIQPIGAEARRKQKLDRLVETQKKADAEIVSYKHVNDSEFKKSLLAMLYWTEGSMHGKVSGLIFTNTDPRLLQLYICLLRQTYILDESMFRIRLHLHYYHKIRAAKKFWSQALTIPESQFNATYIKKRSRNKRFRQNFAGICFIKYGNGKIREELLATGQALYAIVAKSRGSRLDSN